MQRSISTVTVIVREYNEAITCFTVNPGFRLLQDDAQADTETLRVLIAPNKDSESRIILVKASDEEQAKLVGNQAAAKCFGIWTQVIAGVITRIWSNTESCTRIRVHADLARRKLWNRCNIPRFIQKPVGLDTATLV